MKKFLWSLFEMFETLVIAIVAVLLVRSFVTQPFLVSGSSMEPTFNDGNYLLVDELSYDFRVPERGEVIVFKYPSDPSSYFIKRIVGLPGETVVIRDGKVSVRNTGGTEVLNEPYVLQSDTTSNVERTLGNGEYFVMGDNRNFSFDSRSWGPVPAKNIVGVVRFRLWPLQSAMAFSTPHY